MMTEEESSSWRSLFHKETQNGIVLTTEPQEQSRQLVIVSPPAGASSSSFMRQNYRWRRYEGRNFQTPQLHVQLSTNQAATSTSTGTREMGSPLFVLANGFENGSLLENEGHLDNEGLFENATSTFTQEGVNLTQSGKWRSMRNRIKTLQLMRERNPFVSVF